MSNFAIEALKPEQLPEVLEIYNYYVLETTSTFHIHALSLPEMSSITFFANRRHKSFALLDKDKLCGYVLLHEFRTREAYNDCAEVSLYLRSDYTGRGLGTMALQYIEKVARENQFHVLVATISGQNKTSQQVFAKNGYVQCAYFREVGKKFGQVLDSVSYQKILTQ